VDAEFFLDPRLAGSDTFFLEVRGDDMRDAGIFDGDLVLVDPAPGGILREGALLAAQVDGRAVVRRYVLHHGEAALEPADPATPVLAAEGDEFTVLGRVTGLFRRFTLPEPALV